MGLRHERLIQHKGIETTGSKVVKIWSGITGEVLFCGTSRGHHNIYKHVTDTIESIFYKLGRFQEFDIKGRDIDYVEQILTVNSVGRNGVGILINHILIYTDFKPLLQEVELLYGVKNPVEVTYFLNDFDIDQEHILEIGRQVEIFMPGTELFLKYSKSDGEINLRIELSPDPVLGVREFMAMEKRFDHEWWYNYKDVARLDDMVHIMPHYQERKVKRLVPLD